MLKINEFSFKEYFSSLIKDGDVLHLGFDGAISGTCACAKSAAEELNKESKVGKVYVVDTLTGSGGQAIILKEVLKKLGEGKTIEELISFVEDLKTQIRIKKLVNSLEKIKNLIKIKKGYPIFKLDDIELISIIKTKVSTEYKENAVIDSLKIELNIILTLIKEIISKIDIMKNYETVTVLTDISLQVKTIMLDIG